MNNYLDHYCERIALGLWGEPLNVVSNLAFLLAAFILSRHIYAQKQFFSTRYWDLWVLVGLLALIGIGSSVWHLFATSWALWADRVPILIFINLYLISCLIRVLKLSVVTTLILFVLYHIVNSFTQFYFPTGTMNGSLFYAPTWVFLIGITIALWYRNAPINLVYLKATILFSGSLILRTIDNAVCELFPLGSHFIWHILNAITLYYLMIGIFINAKNN